MYYLVTGAKPLDHELVEHTMNSMIEDELLFEVIDTHTMLVESGFSISNKLAQSMDLLVADLGTSLTILGTPFISFKIKTTVLVKAFEYARNNYISLADLVIKAMYSKDLTPLEAVNDFLGNIDRDLVQSALSYIKAGSNVVESAKLLYIHRNTMNYRLSKFMDETNFDIRDFEHTTLLYLYGVLNHLI